VLSVEIVVNTVFGDESYDEKKQRVYAVAGLFGDKSQWENTESEWLKLTKGEEVHASECETKDKNYYKALVTVLVNSAIWGWGAAMSLEDYATIFDQSTGNLPYYFCFFKVIEHFAYYTRLLIPQDKVEFTFDRNLETQYNATFMYDYLIKLPEWTDASFMSDEISFSSRKNPKVQMADLWVREVMKYTDKALISNSPVMRLSLMVLTKTKRFAFDMYEKSYFVDMKRQIRERHEPGHSIEEYHSWRDSNNMQDTTENRIKYHMYLNLLEEQKKRDEKK
jgi:hypothetical protein